MTQAAPPLELPQLDALIGDVDGDAVARLYHPVRHGRWQLVDGGPVLTRGYWSAPQLVSRFPALLRDGETWMSLSPVETESQAIGVTYAHGHVVIFGLGMGWIAAVCALRRQVTRVTVVEQDPDVIAMHRDLNLFAQLPDDAGAKVEIVQGDAFGWRSAEKVDVFMPDIWLPLVSDGRVAEVWEMQHRVGADAVYFWGQELEIARHARAAGLTLDAAGIAETVEGFDLPLVGLDRPDYPVIVAAAAESWMRDRWVDGGRRI